MAWQTAKHPSGRRYWFLPGTEYTFESTGTTVPSAVTGSNGHRVGGGYRPARGRQGLGVFSSVQAAKDRVERDVAAKS